MYNIDEKTVRAILKSKFSALVGKSCKRLELLQSRFDIDANQKISIAKSLIRELDYETMRDIEECISSFSDGTKIQVSLTKPER